MTAIGENRDGTGAFRSSDYVAQDDMLQQLEEIEYVDISKVAEEDLPFMIKDSDTGKYYDMRNDQHLDRLSTPAGEMPRMSNILLD